MGFFYWTGVVFWIMFALLFTAGLILGWTRREKSYIELQREVFDNGDIGEARPVDPDELEDEEMYEGWGPKKIFIGVKNESNYIDGLVPPEGEKVKSVSMSEGCKEDFDEDFREDD